jgi:hypothetical protein
MGRARVSEAIRRAALLPLSLAACGGATEPLNASDAAPDVAGDAGPGEGGPPPPMCTLASKTTISQWCNNLVYKLAGPISACDPGDGGSLPLATCQALCPANTMAGAITGCSVYSGSATDNELTCVGTFNIGPCGTGRRPEGLAAAEKRDATDRVGAFLSQMAWLEAASVPAFERLARELEAHGAPAPLRKAARRASADEVRHAQQMGAFAERAGAVVPPAVVEDRPVRSLEAMAIENIVEGCVRETFGAAVAAVQAARAVDAGFRAAMERVARDEARHARLSWTIAEWLASKLDAQSMRRVSQARDRAIDELLRETSGEPHPAVVRELGVPSSGMARAMVHSLRASLWAA